MLLPQTLDISYSGVHGNKKFPTVEGPEVVRWGKGLTWLGLGVEASRKFYFGILNSPVPERIEPAHMWIREQAQGSGNLFSDSKFSGDIFAGAKGLAGGLGGLGWKGGCPGNSIFNSKFPVPHPVRLGWVGAWGWLRACRGSRSAEKAVRVSSPQQDDTVGIRNSATLKRSSRTTTELQRIWG